MLTQLLSLQSNSTQEKDKEDLLPSEELIKMAGAEVSLKLFTQQAWHVLEPTTEFVDGWHLDALCEHLEALYTLEIRNLLINIPPRHMKSLECSVFFPCWVWVNDPASRWLYSSYVETLSKRDSLKCRRLIQSDWYQTRWGDRFQICSDQNEKLRFENNKTGYRLSTSVDGKAAGEGGDYIIADDPHNTKEAESELKRANALIWWDETMSTRVNNPKTGRKLIVMQRLNEGDLSGHVLEKDLDYVHLMLPAEFEVSRRCVTVIGFEDPRTEEGEPLWEERFGREELRVLKEDLVSEYAISGQLQQRPAPRGGGMFKIDKVGIVNVINQNNIIRSVRYWDKAGTEGGGSNTAGVLVHKMSDNSFVVADRVMGQWSTGKRERIIKQTAEIDGKLTYVWVEQEPGSGGKESAENTIRMLAGYRVKADKVTGSKEVRAEPFANQVEIGNVYLLKGDWNRSFLDHLEVFPVGKVNDDVDAGAGAFNKLMATKARAGAW